MSFCSFFGKADTTHTIDQSFIATSTWTSNVETRFSMSSQMAMISIAWIGRFICKNTKTWRDTEADLGKLGLGSGSTDLLGHN